jgi:TorA maturation chaperone TorD
MNARAAMPEAGADVPQEDRARADLYGLLARLFYAGPDAGLLAALAAADEFAGEGVNLALAQAWNSLIAAAAAMDAEAAQAEYDSVFVGTGKAEVTPYAAHYLAESNKENVLVQLRADLAAMGLSRHPDTAELEDHYSGLCEVMRHLIFFTPDVALQKQKNFFMRYLSSSYAGFCMAVVASPNTNFYKHVARFTQAFLDVEGESFEMAQ